MERIIVAVRIDNALDASKTLTCKAVVDTGASLMVLPAAWKYTLGELDSTRTIELDPVTHRMTSAEVCGPVRIQIEGFRPIHSEVAFVEAGEFEPLLGGIVLAQSQAAVDMLDQRLVPFKQMDLK